MENPKAPESTPLSWVIGSFFLAIGLLLASSYVGQRRQERLYNKAEAIAVSCFGDKEYPLDSREKQEWYRSMGVREKEEPSYEQLEHFVESH